MKCSKIAGFAVLISFLVLNSFPVSHAQKAGKAEPAYLNWIREAKKAEETGSPRVAEKQYNVGMAFYRGAAGARWNYRKAFEWFSKAAGNGDASACVSLGEMYQYGHAVKKDKTRAVRWYRKAAENGHSRGMEKLGDMYYYGKGVRRNYTEAAKWYRKAAEKTMIPEASSKLARLYYLGEGVKENHTEALKWFLKADELGGIYIAHYMAHIYEGRKKYAEAEKCLIRASMKGDTIAMHYLAKMYTSRAYPKGKGVPKNRVEAYKWLTVLTEKELHPRGKKLLRQLNRKMTKARISRARRLASPLIKKLVTDDDRRWKEYSKTLKKL